MVEFMSRDYLLHRMASPSAASDFQPNYSQQTELDKPRFSIRKERGKIILQFAGTQNQKVRVYSKRGLEDDFSMLTEISDSQYIDSRPNLFEAPEIREYIAKYFDGENEVGKPSDVVLIINK